MVASLALAALVPVFVTLLEGISDQSLSQTVPCNCSVAPAPVYTLDLALAPEDRWDAMVGATLDAQGFDASFGVYANFLEVRAAI